MKPLMSPRTTVAMTAIERLFSTPDDNDFLSTLHRLLLGPVMGGSKKMSTLDATQRPISRLKLLRVILEGKPFNDRSAHKDILHLQSTSFLQAAYQKLLARDPDPEGVKHYAPRLAQRQGRALILQDIEGSLEFRLKAQHQREAVDSLVRLSSPSSNSGSIWAAFRRPRRSLKFFLDHRTLAELESAESSPSDTNPASTRSGYTPPLIGFTNLDDNPLRFLLAATLADPEALSTIRRANQILALHHHQ